MDHFLYGHPETWGNDEIYQLEDGDIKIVFFWDGEEDLESNDIQIMTPEENVTIFAHESGSITIYGQVDLAELLVSCRDPEEIDSIPAFNGFEAGSSDQIFESTADGLLA